MFNTHKLREEVVFSSQFVEISVHRAGLRQSGTADRHCEGETVHDGQKVTK